MALESKYISANQYMSTHLTRNVKPPYTTAHAASPIDLVNIMLLLATIPQTGDYKVCFAIPGRIARVVYFFVSK